MSGVAATFEFVVPSSPTAHVPVNQRTVSVDHLRHPDVLLPIVAAFLVLLLLLAWVP